MLHAQSWKRKTRPDSDGRIGSLLVYLFFRKVNKNFATGQPDPPRSEQWTAAEPNVVGRPAKWEFASIITHRLAVVSRRGSRRTNQPTKRTCERYRMYPRNGMRLSDDRLFLKLRSESIFYRLSMVIWAYPFTYLDFNTCNINLFFFLLIIDLIFSMLRPRRISRTVFFQRYIKIDISLKSMFMWFYLMLPKEIYVQIW